MNKMENNNFDTSSSDDLTFSSSFDIEHTLERPAHIIQVHYQPPDKANFWMFCMIGMGMAFVVFVIGSIYLMCKSQKNGQPTPIRRNPTSKSRGGAGGERSAIRDRELL